MTTIFARFTLALCASIGACILLFNSTNDPGTHTTPSSKQPPSTVLPQSPLKQYTNAKSKPSMRHGSPDNPGAKKVAPAPQASRQNDFFVEITNGEVTLHAKNQSLKKVLEALARASGVQINSQLIGDRQLSIELVRVPLDRALQAILQFEDSFFAFTSHEQSQVTVKAVWVVPAGSGGTWPPQTAACLREAAALEQQLASTSPSQRADAIETLIDLQGPEAVQAVVRSLADHDDDVRYRALQKAYGVGVVLPPEVLGQLAQHDRSELVRMMAVDAIGHHPSLDAHDKLAVARSAINDNSPAVQTRASEIVSHLEAASFMQEQDAWLHDDAQRTQSKEFQGENSALPTPPQQQVQ
jgi:hypothetical protein